MIPSTSCKRAKVSPCGLNEPRYSTTIVAASTAAPVQPSKRLPHPPQASSSLAPGHRIPGVPQRVAQGVIQRSRGPPAEPLQLRGIAHQVRQPAGPEARRIDLDAHLHARELDHALQDAADAAGFTAADVVGLARLAAIEQQAV